MRKNDEMMPSSRLDRKIIKKKMKELRSNEVALLLVRAKILEQIEITEEDGKKATLDIEDFEGNKEAALKQEGKIHGLELAVEHINVHISMISKTVDHLKYYGW